MKKYPSFKIDLLGCNVVVILDKDWLKVAGDILKKDLSEGERFNGANGIAFALDNSYYIAAPKTVKESTLYHECFHVMSEICNDFEIDITHENHEFGAYLIEYLIEQTIKIRKGKK